MLKPFITFSFYLHSTFSVKLLSDMMQPEQPNRTSTTDYSFVFFAALVCCFGLHYGNAEEEISCIFRTFHSLSFTFLLMQQVCH